MYAELTPQVPHLFWACIRIRGNAVGLVTLVDRIIYWEIIIVNRIIIDRQNCGDIRLYHFMIISKYNFEFLLIDIYYYARKSCTSIRKKYVILKIYEQIIYPSSPSMNYLKLMELYNLSLKLSPQAIAFTAFKNTISNFHKF